MSRTTELLDSVRGASLMTPEPFRSDIFKMLDELDELAGSREFACEACGKTLEITHVHCGECSRTVTVQTN